MLDYFHITNINVKDNINKYTFENRKLIEIIRCVNDETEVFVVDETTTALSLEGRLILYKLIHQLKEKGKSVIFISHDMDEVLEQCTDITVLRDGNIIGHLNRAEMDAPDAIQKIRYMMVGREIGDFSLKLHKGEIIGFGGLSGCGMHELGRAAFGLEKLQAGQVIRNGKEIKSPLQAITEGIGYISKNRDKETVILEGSIQDNIVLPLLPELSHGSFINPRVERERVTKEIEAFKIKCNSEKQWVNTLSGGNKQKVSFAKWTAKGSEVLIMDCPTRGVDIGVKQSMYELIDQMKKEGKAIILISEEIVELIGMADKIIIMKDFKKSGEVDRSRDLKEIDMIEYMI
jgi:ribose transport system ATP-binding protein